VITCECRVLVPWTGTRGAVGSAGVEARDVLELEAAFPFAAADPLRKVEGTAAVGATEERFWPQVEATRVRCVGLGDAREGKSPSERILGGVEGLMRGRFWDGEGGESAWAVSAWSWRCCAGVRDEEAPAVPLALDWWSGRSAAAFSVEIRFSIGLEGCGTIQESMRRMSTRGGGGEGVCH